MTEWHDGTTNTATMQALMDARNAGAFYDTKDSPGSDRGYSVPVLRSAPASAALCQQGHAGLPDQPAAVIQGAGRNCKGPGFRV